MSWLAPNVRISYSKVTTFRQKVKFLIDFRVCLGLVSFLWWGNSQNDSSVYIPTCRYWILDQTNSEFYVYLYMVNNNSLLWQGYTRLMNSLPEIFICLIKTIWLKNILHFQPPTTILWKYFFSFKWCPILKSFKALFRTHINMVVIKCKAHLSDYDQNDLPCYESVSL